MEKAEKMEEALPKEPEMITSEGPQKNIDELNSEIIISAMSTFSHSLEKVFTTNLFVQYRTPQFKVDLHDPKMHLLN